MLRSPRPEQHQRRRHSAQRGAVLVEALLVIVFMVIGLFGLMFFYNFYLHQIHAMRVAQASVIAYSMGGCSENQPSDWIGSDRGPLRVGLPDPQSENASDPNNIGSNRATSDDSGVQTVLGQLGGILSDGTGILNPTTTSSLSGRVAVEKRPDAVVSGSHNTVFEGTVAATSYVSCSELPRDGNVEVVLNMVWNTFKSIVGL